MHGSEPGMAGERFALYTSSKRGGVGETFMFGMLDYRAYKLLWLICWPLRFVMFVATWGAVFVAVK